MRFPLYPFVTVGLLLVSSCGSSSETKAGEEQAAVYGGEEDGTGGASGGDDATEGEVVANSDVKDKPLLKTCYKADPFICQIEATIVSETNLVRGSSRKPVAHDFESSFVARLWSDEQAKAGNISHDGFPYNRKAALKAEFPNATWAFYAENVAMFSGRDTDPVEIGKKFVNMWKNSEGHLKNILSNNAYLGVGVSKIGNSYYATQIFH